MILATDGGTAARALRNAVSTLRSRKRRSEGGVASLIRERAVLSKRIMNGEPDMATVARWQDISRAIEASLIAFRARTRVQGASHIRVE